MPMVRWYLASSALIAPIKFLKTNKTNPDMVGTEIDYQGLRTPEITAENLGP